MHITIDSVSVLDVNKCTRFFPTIQSSISTQKPFDSQCLMLASTPTPPLIHTPVLTYTPKCVQGVKNSDFRIRIHAAVYLP